MMNKWDANPAFYRGRNFDHELEQRVASARSTDPLWKAAVADNQWYIAKATMYGISALVERDG